LAGRYGSIGPRVIEQFDEAVFPVSTELFEIGGKGLRVIGEFSRSAKEKN
jgi:hypothetical protein